MGIVILTEGQFTAWIKHTKYVGFSLFQWIKNNEAFTGVVLDYSNELYNRQPSIRRYYSKGKFSGFSPEDWLETLSEDEQTDALFRLDEWKNQTWGRETDLLEFCNQTFDLFLPQEDLNSGYYFKLGDHVFQVLEDEEDGYRSRMENVILLNSPLYGFSETAAAKVIMKETGISTRRSSGYNDFEGFMIFDVNTGHGWLRFGTDNCDDYYPSFIYELNIPG